MAKCAICDKSVSYGKKLSITRSHIREAKKVKVCAHCLRSGKLNMA